MSDDSSCCREKKQKVFQGKAYIPDDHIQLISKYFQGANLNLNFALDDEESCERVCKKKRKSRSKSRCRRRHRKRSHRKTKRCKCCTCCDKREEPKSCCCGQQKTTCCETIDPCARVKLQNCCREVPKSNNCCCESPSRPQKKQTCCEKIDPFSQPTKKQTCCEKIDPCAQPLANTNCCQPVQTVCCCERPEPEKVCCCCGRPCVEGNEDKQGQRNKKDKTRSKGRTEEAEDSSDRSDAKPDKKKTNKHPAKQPSPPRSAKSSDSKSSKSSDTTNVKQVYIAKHISSLERDPVYGRYWYHRPPLENTITHCDEDDSPLQDYRIYQEYEYDGQTLPETLANRAAAGLCMACKEPMCLICKMNVCECDCEKPNFVICNPCKHRLTPRPPKKPCPPKKPKPKPAAKNNGCDEAMFLLPLLASMQGNRNSQQCGTQQCNYNSC